LAAVCKNTTILWPVLALAVIILGQGLLLPGAALAEPDKPVRIEAELGWDGQGEPGRYAPAVVHLKNTGGRDLSGVLEAINYYKFTYPVPPGSAPGKNKTSFFPSAAYGERVSLPAGGEKKVILWFPMNARGGRTDFVFRSGDRELARISKNLPDNNTNAGGPRPGGVGVLGEIPAALEKVRVVMPDGVIRYAKALQLTSELFPRRGEELNAFKTILVTGKGASSLNADQRKALARWVEDGGHLVVSGGLEIEEALAALPPGTVDVEIGAINERSNWQAAAAWLGQKSAGVAVNTAVAGLTGEGEAWGPEGNPLGRRFTLANGQVTLLSFDPNQSPWQSGPLGESLWQKFLAVPDMDKWGYDPYNNDYRLSNLIHQTNSLSPEAFPGWQPVGMYLLLFLIAAGPVSYFVLRRIRHPEYTWVAVPLLAVIFAGGIYLYMLQTGGNVLANVVQVVDKQAGGETNGYTAVGYFAPTRPDFTAVLEDPDRSVMVQPLGGRPPELMAEQTEPPYSIIRGSDLSVRFTDTTQWYTRAVAFRNDHVSRAVQDLKATVEIQGNRIIARVENKTNLHLDHVVVFLGSNYKMLGDLAPNSEKQAQMEIVVPQYNPKGNYGPEYFSAWQVFQYPDGPPVPPKPGMPMPPPTNRRLDASEQRRANLMDNWVGNMRRRGPVETGWPLTVLAWSDSPVAEPGMKGMARSPQYLSMFVLAPELKLPAGSFTIPAGLVMPEVTDSQVRSMFGHNSLRGMEGGSVTFAFKPNLPEQVKINKVTLTLDYFPVAAQRNRGMGPPSAKPTAVPRGVLEVYHPGKNAWQPLSGSKTFELSGDYATAGGEVKLRMYGGNSAKGTGFYFLPPTVAYGGEKI
jgi:hypothetical protein